MLWGLGCLSAGRNSSNCSASEPLDSSFTTESTHLTATQLAALEAEQANEQCWICLESGSTTHRLVRPCACPRFVHECCMARWQLQSAGKECVPLQSGCSLLGAPFTPERGREGQAAQAV